MNRPILESPGEYLMAAAMTVAVLAVAGTWWTGQVAGLLFGGHWPHANLADAWTVLTRLPSHWSDPRRAWPASARDGMPGPAGFAVSAAIVITAAVAPAAWLAHRHGHRQQIAGFASPAQVRALLSPAAALSRSALLRPSLPPKAARAEDVSVPLGRAGRERAAAAIDASVLVLAAPRQGKTSQIVIPWLDRWPGPAITTSVRSDVALSTLALRRERGPVAVLDLTGTIWPCPLRWSPVNGCDAFDIARQRADVLVAVGKTDNGPGDSTNAGFFGLTATNLLAGWLHSAALSGRTMSDVLLWALDEHRDDCIRLLRDHPRAAPGVAGMLDNIYRAPAETRSNMWATVMTAVAPLLSSLARDAFTPPAGTGFSPEEFLASNGTVYLIVPEQQASDLAPLITALTDDILRAAAQHAALAPTGRMDPPLGLLLDEVANVVPLPRLPQLMSHAGGTGIFVAAVLQDIAQARQRWGRDGAEMLWAAATVKVALGGLGGEELEDLSRLAGTYREPLTTAALSPATGYASGPSLHTTVSDRPAISPAQIRTLSEQHREALVLHASSPPVITRMTRHYESPRARDYARSAEQTRAVILNGHHSAIRPAGSTQPSAAAVRDHQAGGEQR